MTLINSNREPPTWGAIAGMGGLFQAAGGFDAFGQAFNKQPTKAPTPFYGPVRPKPNPWYN